MRALVETDPGTTAASRFWVAPVAGPDGRTPDAPRPGESCDLEVFRTRA